MEHFDDSVIEIDSFRKDDNSPVLIEDSSSSYLGSPQSKRIGDKSHSTCNIWEVVAIKTFPSIGIVQTTGSGMSPVVCSGGS